MKPGWINVEPLARAARTCNNYFLQLGSFHSGIYLGTNITALKRAVCSMITMIKLDKMTASVDEGISYVYALLPGLITVCPDRLSNEVCALRRNLTAIRDTFCIHRLVGCARVVEPS